MNQKIPQHVAIIMDGNGRWAENRGLQRSEGHSSGVNAVKTTVKACVDRKINVLSIWAFGSENWARPEKEVNFLMQLFVQALTQEINELHQQGVRMCFTGNRAGLGSVLRERMQMAEELTINNDQLIMNIVMNYGGKWDIVQAVKKLVTQVVDGHLSLDEINEQTFAKQLDASYLPDPDLFIRTGGEKRLSNFFLWQLAYTELYFSDVYWPDFTPDEFDKALASYGSRERRFGQTSSQLIDKSTVTARPSSRGACDEGSPDVTIGVDAGDPSLSGRRGEQLQSIEKKHV